MLELIRKSLLAGIGAVVLTKQKVTETTERLVTEGKLSAAEAQKLGEELIKAGERQWDEISTRLGDIFKKGAENVEDVKPSEFEELRARVEALEKRFSGDPKTP